MVRVNGRYGKRIVALAALFTLTASTLLAGCGKEKAAPEEPEVIAVESFSVDEELSVEEELSAEEETSAGDDMLSVEEEEAPEPVDMSVMIPGEIIEEVDEDQIDAYFRAYEIPDHVFERINGRSYRDNPNIGLDDLRYMKVIHYNFNHQVQVGELIVNAALAEDYVEIFHQLYDAGYEIQSMYLVDNYWTGDGGTSDSASIEQNNTSAFCYRTATGSGNLSNHAYGRAIDINPQQNPYVSYASGAPSWSHANASQYIDRTTGLPHVITHDDICYQIFMEHGFSWGGDWSGVHDYQHFEKEY